MFVVCRLTMCSLNTLIASKYDIFLMLLLLNSLFIAAQLDGPTVHHLNVSDEDADHLEQRDKQVLQ